MKIFKLIVLVQICLLQTLSAQRLDKYPVPHPEGYVCYQAGEKLTVDGKLDEKAWADAPWTNQFVDIEGDRKPKPYFKTRAKMLWDVEYFYVAAEMEEPHIWANLTERDAVIFYDNDFEVFIDPNGDNHMYYEFEMNALNTVWDLMLGKPYRDGAPAIDSWDIQGLKSGVEIFGTLNDPSDKDDKWTVEIAFPWKVLEEAAQHKGIPNDGEQWRVGFSRVEWLVDIIDGKYKKKHDANGKRLPEHNWIWSEQGKISMHQPETWGYVQFSTKNVGPNAVTFNPDKFFKLKMALMEVYFQQKEYYKKHGAFTTKLDDLDLSEFNSKNFASKIEVQVMDGRFVAKSKKGSVVWMVDEKSKLVSKKL